MASEEQEKDKKDIQDSPLCFCKTQRDAVSYLRDSGYKVSKSQFNRDVKARRVPMSSDGQFEQSALLGYAAGRLSPLSQSADRAMSDATQSKLSADAEFKSIQAKRMQLKLQREQGLLMLKSDHERDLGARANFFRNEVRNFIQLQGPAIIEQVGGSQDKLQSLILWWNNSTDSWMDAWSQDREFSVPDELEETEDSLENDEIEEEES